MVLAERAVILLGFCACESVLENTFLALPFFMYMVYMGVYMWLLLVECGQSRFPSAERLSTKMDVSSERFPCRNRFFFKVVDFVVRIARA